jgi:hypothetical protein
VQSSAGYGSVETWRILAEPHNSNKIDPYSSVLFGMIAQNTEYLGEVVSGKTYVM